MGKAPALIFQKTSSKKATLDNLLGDYSNGKKSEALENFGRKNVFETLEILENWRGESSQKGRLGRKILLELPKKNPALFKDPQIISQIIETAKTRNNFAAYEYFFSLLGGLASKKCAISAFLPQHCEELVSIMTGEGNVPRIRGKKNKELFGFECTNIVNLIVLLKPSVFEEKTMEQILAARLKFPDVLSILPLAAKSKRNRKYVLDEIWRLMREKSRNVFYIASTALKNEKIMPRKVIGKIYSLADRYACIQDAPSEIKKEIIRAWISGYGINIKENILAIRKLESDIGKKWLELSKTYGIRHFGRYSHENLMHIYKNEKQLIEKPVFCVLFPATDYNGAFMQNKEEILSLMPDFDVRIVEAETCKEAGMRLRTVNSLFGKISSIIVGAHGDPRGARFGYSKEEEMTIKNAHQIFGENISLCFEPVPSIILISCSIGAKYGFARRLHNKLGKEAFIYAPATDTNLKSIRYLGSGEAGFDIKFYGKGESSVALRPAYAKYTDR